MSAFGRVAIVGVGLIGGSLGMAIRRRGLAREVRGVFRSADAIPEAVARGAVDSGTVDVEAAVKGVDLVVLATPPATVVRVAARVVPCLAPGAILTDVTSVKAEIVRAIEPLLQPVPGVTFVGGHPMAGNEGRGVASATPSLFEGTAYLITPTSQTPSDGVNRLADLARGIGAFPVLLDPEEHDRVVAFVSHLPYLVAAALVRATDPAVVAAAGPAFLGATRVAASPVELWGQICRLNRVQILAALRTFEDELRRLEQALVDVDRLDALLEEAQAVRVRLSASVSGTAEARPGA